METFPIVLKLFLSFILGAVIGLERQINENNTAHNKTSDAQVGIRTFSLITVLGAIVGFLSGQYLPLALLFGSAFFILLIVFFVIDSVRTKDPGITTELAMIYSFMIGILISLDLFPIQVTLALTVIIILLLSQKERIKDVVDDIQKKEINAFIGYLIIALVILPFLPNTSYALADIPGAQGFLANIGLNASSIVNTDIINPFKLWLIVALVTGIDLIGYILERTIGQRKGWLVASAVGGFVSSTATTQSLAQESRNVTRVNHLVAAAVLSNMISFIQIAFLVGALNAQLLAKLIPVLTLMIIAAVAAIFYFLKIAESKNKQSNSPARTRQKKIIEISTALKFALLFLTISIVSKIALSLFGGSGFLAATGIGALIGLDAVMINTAQVAGHRIDLTLAVIAFILANAVNLGGKVAYSSMLGKKEFTVKLAISMLLIIIASLLSFLFI